MKTRSLHMVAVVLGTICLSVSLVSAQDSPGQSIGLFTAAQGNVTVAHPGSALVQPVNVHDEVLFRDVIETQNESRTKAFFEDDSILTVGENSKVEITEYLYNPDQNMRRTVVKLLHGQLRALVSKVFTASGSKFEIHTPTAVAAARGTYFVVWFEDGVSGIANIGNSGRVAFSSGGTEIIVDPGRFSTAAVGGVPSQPNVISTGLPGSEHSELKAEEKIQRAVSTTSVMPGEKATEKIQQTEEKVTEKTQQTGEQTAEKSVQREHKKHAHAAEIIERTEKGEVQKHHHTKIDNQTAATLARVMNAIEGTVLKDTPKHEAARDAIRAFHHVTPVSPLVSGIAKSAPATNRNSTGKHVSPESDTTKRKPVHGDNETTITPTMTEGSPTTSGVQSSGASSATTAAPATPTGSGPMTGPATPNVNTVSTTVMPATPAAPAVPVASATPVVPVVPATPVVPVVLAAPVVPVVPTAPIVPVVPATLVVPAPTPSPVAPTVKVTPVTPPFVISDEAKHKRGRK